MAQHFCWRRVLGSMCFALLVAAHGTPAFGVTRQETSAVMQSTDVPKPVTRDRLNLCMAQIARVMHVSDQELPQVVLLQVSREAGEQIGFQHNHVYRNTGSDGPALYYEIWMVGTTSETDLVEGVLTVFETHFGLTLTTEQRLDAIKQVMTYMSTTVDAKALARPSRNVDRFR